MQGVLPSGRGCMPRVEFIRQEESLYAGFRFVLNRRSELPGRLTELRDALPREMVTGPPLLILHYISSEKEGTLAELGFPVNGEYSDGKIRTGTLKAAECLALFHEGPMAGLNGAYRELFDRAAESGIVSDEYGLEILHDISNHDQCRIEVRLIIHPWEILFRDNVVKVLGTEAAESILKDLSSIDSKSGLDQRFQRVKGALMALERSSDHSERYDCISRCAHVFPREQIQKLKAVFDGAITSGLSILEAVDKVIAFMDSDPGWSEGAHREGRTIFTAKGPMDRDEYQLARTPAEKAEAACFCPIIRKKLAEGMPGSFCNCGAGWYRQQWEGATGMPVRVEILSSLLEGDPECRFAVHLPEEG